MDILDSLSFIHVIYNICTLSQWKLNRKTLRLEANNMLVVYTIVVILFAIAFTMYGLFGEDEFTNANVNEIGETVDSIQILGIRIAHIVTISEGVIRRKDQQKFYEKIRQVDDIFERSLNVDVKNGEFRRDVIKGGSIMLGIYIASEIFMVASQLISPDQHFTLYWIFYFLPFFVCALRYFQIFIWVMIIKRRLDNLIRILKAINFSRSTTKIHETTEVPPPPPPLYIGGGLPIFDIRECRNRCRYDMENPELKRLLTVRDLYNRLWELTSITNQCFGVSMLINLANDFISITSNCYWIFLNFKEFSPSLTDYMQIASSTVWSIPHLFNVLVLAIMCDRTARKNTSIALCLHCIDIDLLNDNHNAMIQQFSLQLLHQKLSFTAAGFFQVDCTLLYTIVGAITTYLIILIQFHMSEQKSP